MRQLLHQGGLPAWLVLTFGLLSLAGAAWFVRGNRSHALAFQRAMTWVLVATMLGGFASGVSASINGLSRLPPALHDRGPMLLLYGIGESLAIVILGSAFVALSWLVAAIGMRRAGDVVTE